MLYYKINGFLSLRLEGNQTNVYVKNQLFNQCKYLLINIHPYTVREYDTINSIDEAIDHYHHLGGSDYVPPEINPRTEFWGHCSNLQAWYEHNYDTRLLHSNLSFPLLRKLYEAGDPLAKKVFKEEIAKRCDSGSPTVIQSLIDNHYLDVLSEEELASVLEQPTFFKALKKEIPRHNSNLVMDVLAHLIVIYRKLQLYKEGILLIKELLKLKPNSVIEWEELALFYYKIKQIENAKKACAQALKLDAYSERAFLLLGKLYNEKNDYKKAIFYTKKSLAICYKKYFNTKSKAEYLYVKEFLGYVLTNAGQYQEALRIHHYILKQNPKNVIAWNNAAWTFNYLRQYDKAIIAAKRGLFLDRTLSNLWNHLGYAFYFKGEKELGIKYIKKAVEENPEYTNGWYNLVKILISEGQYEEAIRALLEVKKTDTYFKFNYVKHHDLIEHLISSCIICKNDQISINLQLLEDWLPAFNELNNIISIYGIGSAFDRSLPSDWKHNDIDLIILVKSLEHIPQHSWTTVRFTKILSKGLWIGYNTLEGLQNEAVFNAQTFSNYKWSILDIKYFHNSVLLYGKDIRNQLPEIDQLKYDYSDLLKRVVYHLEKSFILETNSPNFNEQAQELSKAIFKFGFYLCVYFDANFKFTSLREIVKKLKCLTEQKKVDTKVLQFIQNAINFRRSRIMEQNFAEMKQRFSIFLFSSLIRGTTHDKMSFNELLTFLDNGFQRCINLASFLVKLKSSQNRNKHALTAVPEVSDQA